MTDLSATELARFSRQIIMPGVAKEGQQKLKNSRVLIVGVGGLGCPAALYLAGAGVGTIGLADFDSVALHNLHRQILFRPADIDRPKVEVARERLQEYYPEGKFEMHAQGLNADNASDIFSNYDLILDCADNFSTRYLLNDAAFFTKKPFVQASLYQWEGRVVLYHPEIAGACHRCLFPEPPPPDTVPNCAEAGAIGALCGTIASYQTMLALRWLLRANPRDVSLANELLTIDFQHMKQQQLRIPADPHCALCGEEKRRTIRDLTVHRNTSKSCTSPSFMKNEILPLEIEIEQAAQMLSAGEAKLIDVREDFEREICLIENAIHIPMAEIPSKLDALSTDETYIIHCHHGGRSLRVTEFLRQHGFSKTTNMIGGIDQWAVQQSPEMNRY